MKKSICILLCVLLSACATMRPAPSATPKAIDSATPEIISTPTITLTATMQTASTPTPAELFQESPTKQAYDAQTTKIAKFPITCTLEIGGNFISPNENWMATQCSAHKEGSNLEIVNRKGKQWAVQAKDYGEFNGLKPEYWSNDEEYLYFASYFQGSSGGYACFHGYGAAQSLHRIKLNDGTISTVLPNGRILYDFSFSPSGRRLAYRGHGDLIILDLQTGDEININIGNNVVGTLTWLPDGLELAYATCQEPDNYGVLDDYSPKKSTVKIFSIQQNASRTILEIEKKHLSIAGWDANNIITIYSEYENLFFNVNAGQWITPTPTP